MLDTPEKKLEHLFDEFIWAWYRSCLGVDRKQKPMLVLPEKVRILLTSPLILNLILTRWREGLSICFHGINITTVRLNELNEMHKIIHKTSDENIQLFYEELYETRKLINDHNRRIRRLPSTEQELKEQVEKQALWMYKFFTVSEREMVNEIADWYCESIK